MGAVIDVSNLTKTYGSLKAVNNVSLSVEQGEIFGLIGPNGAGKSTMIRLLTGQSAPDHGSIRVLDTNVIEKPVSSRKQVGVIPEQEVPPSFLTSEEYLRFVSEIRHVKDAEKKMKHWFEFLSFDSQKHKLSKDLSRGTRQKLMMSQAFFFEPKLAFIDEPLVNLDPLIQKKVKTFFKDYTKQGNTIFLCTHVLSIAQELCDRVAFMHNGHIVKTERVKTLITNYGTLEHAFERILS